MEEKKWRSGQPMVRKTMTNKPQRQKDRKLGQLYFPDNCRRRKKAIRNKFVAEKNISVKR